MRPPLPRTVIAATLTTGLTVAMVGPMLATPAEAAPARRISYQQWGTANQFDQGRLAGLRVVRGKLRISTPIGRQQYADPHGGATRKYGFGRWTSPWATPGFGLTELIPSWDATTRGDSWVQIEVRGRSGQGRRSSWDTVARWASGDRTVHRTSLGEQADDLGRMSVDTWRSNDSAGLTSWQVRATLYRKAGTAGTPLVDTLGAMASKLPEVDRVPTSRTGMTRRVTLNVPKYSQMIHQGHYPQFGSGGQAWCSPTSTSMVLGYYDRLPDAASYSWVPRGHPDRFVDHAARMTFDYEYDGTGNWPFNTAYAATYTHQAFVTRLRSLREAERFIKAGIPVVASVAFGPGELDGAPISSTNGHLMVIVGFTAGGDVVVNDPAAQQNKGVRRTYDRGQFENAWLPTSGGLVYVIRTASQDLPARHGAKNW